MNDDRDISDSSTWGEFELTRAILETITDPVLVINSAGVVCLANPAVERYLGYSPAELLGRNISNLMPSPYAQRHDGYLEAYRRTKRPSIIGQGREVEAVTKDGERLPMDLSVSEFTVDGATYFTGVLRDAKERKRRERSEEFSYVAAHDLKAPLRAMHSLAQWISEDEAPNLSPQGQEMVGQIIERAQKMQKLLEGVLTISQLGHQKLHPRYHDVAALVREVRSSLGEEAPLDINVDDAMPRLFVDEHFLVHILQNLLSNAIRHKTADRVTMKVGYHRDGIWGVITVEDDGPGIPDEYRETVFEPFKSLKSKDQGAGSGIGLTIVRRCVEASGGEIHLLPYADRGAAFELRFPAYRFHAN